MQSMQKYYNLGQKQQLLQHYKRSTINHNYDYKPSGLELCACAITQ